jgi:hypothetical protein
MVQAKVMPAWAGTEAAKPVVLGVMVAGAVMTGVIGAATMVLVAVPGALAVPAMVTTQVTVRVPTGPAVKVTLVSVEVPPAVTVPPVTVQV